MSHACHRFWKCYKTLTLCSLLTRCTIPCAGHAKRHLNLQKWSKHVVLLTFEMCFAPQLRALFDISTSKSGPDLVYFVHFDFEMCFAPQRRAIFHLSSLGSAPAALASLLFDAPEPQIIGKTQCFATFLPFRAPASSFFWDFLFFDLSSSLLFADSSHLCFSSVHIVGSLTSKLPSIIHMILINSNNRNPKHESLHYYHHEQWHKPGLLST